MRKIVIRSIAAVASIAAMASLAACGDNSAATTSSNGSSSAAGDQISGTFTGEGATSQEQAIKAWINGYKQKNPNANISYNGTGSGAGVTKFLSGATAWAGSDATLKDSEASQKPSQCAADASIFEVPVYISAIAVVYNISGLDNSKHIQMDAATIAKIFDGKITKWNDPAITSQNPDLALPDKAITVVHRSEESGTTQDFTSYLQDAGGQENWSYKPAKAWPNKIGQGAEGTSGVSNTVSMGDGTIGYIDASKIGKLGSVAVKVGDAYVPYSAEAAAKVVDASPLDDSAKSPRVVIKLDHKTTEANAYPVVLVSYDVVCSAYADANTGKFVKSWLTYEVSDEGQQLAADNVGSAPMSDTLRAKVTKSIETIK